MKSFLSAAAILFLLAAPTRAEGTLDEAIAAYDAGNYEKAYDLFLPLAEAGDAEAQARVGFILERGLSGQPDEIKAAEMYERAALQGHVRASFHLGVILASRSYPYQDQRKAYSFLAFAAMNCDRDAPVALGLLVLDPFFEFHNKLNGFAWLFLGERLGSDLAGHALETALVFMGPADVPRSQAFTEQLQEKLGCVAPP